MNKVITFLTRTRGNPNTASKFGITDFLAYGYLLAGVLIILMPVFWTFLSSIKPERAIDSFDTRLLPIAQIQSDIEGVGSKPIWEYTAEDGTVTNVFKAGPTRKLTDVAPVSNPQEVIQVERTRLAPSEELRIATENYLDPLLSRNGQENFHFGTYLFNSVFVTVVATLLT
ncbi:MAG: carbohydrate ABC transporter permease, partial [Granulosicoccus sp.]|nr:carbohydrate ABC transporter permease [Granulosicoccus sp.]